MNFQCPHCLWIHQLDPGDTRLPPWCKKCGADVKKDDWRPTFDEPTTDSRSRPSPPPFAGAGEVTQVTGTGGKPWLNPPKPAPADPAPAAAAAPPAETDPQPPLSEPAPATGADPDPGLTGAVAVMKYVGFALLVVAPLWAGEVWTFAKNAQKVNGQVKIVWKPEPLKFALYRAEKVIEYEVNGAVHELAAGNNWDEGQWVELLYSPADPGNARIARSLYQWPVILVGASLMLLASAWVGSLVVAENRKKAAPAEATGP